MLLTKNKRLFYLLLAIYALFSFLSPLSKTIFVIPEIILIASILIFDDSDVLCILAFGSCFANCGWKISQFLTSFDIIVGLLIIKQFIIAIKNKDKRNIFFISIMLAVILLATCYGLIVTNLHFYKYAQGLGILLLVTEIGLLGKINLKKLALTLSAGIILSAILSILSAHCGILAEKPYKLVSSTSLRFGAYFLNVNALALYASTCQACLLTLILVKELDIKKWLWLPIVITIIGLSSFSKTFALIAVATYFLFIVIGFIISKHKKKYLIFGILALIILAIVLFICWHYVEMIIDRFGLDKETTNKLNTITTGRLNIWLNYINKWKSSPLYMLFGCGITADNIKKRSTHSFILSLLYKFGIVGTLALIGVVIYILKSKKVGKNHICYWLPLLIILINGLSEDVACSLYTCLPLMISFSFIINGKSRKS